MPAEIKLTVLRSITDYKALCALIHASPSFHGTYLLARNEILTNATLRELEARRIHVLTPVDFAEVLVRGGKELDFNLQPAIEKIYNQVATKSRISLNVDECIALLSLADLKGFQARPNIPQLSPRMAANSNARFFKCITHLDDYLYRLPPGWRSYTLLEFGKQSNVTREWMEQQLKAAHVYFGCRYGKEIKRLADAARNTERKELIENEMEKALKLVKESVGKKLSKAVMESVEGAISRAMYQVAQLAQKGTA